MEWTITLMENLGADVVLAFFDLFGGFIADSTIVAASFSAALNDWLSMISVEGLRFATGRLAQG